MYKGASPLALALLALAGVALSLVARALALRALAPLARLALFALDADELVGRGLLDYQLQQRSAHRPGESFQWLAFLCARGRRRVVHRKALCIRSRSSRSRWAISRRRSFSSRCASPPSVEA